MNSKSLFDMTEEAKQLVKNELPAAYLLMGAPDEAALLKKYRPRKCLKARRLWGRFFNIDFLRRGVFPIWPFAVLLIFIQKENRPFRGLTGWLGCPERAGERAKN